MSIALVAGISVLVLIAVIVLMQRSGPRVTQIDRTVERDKDGDERQ